MFQKSPFYFDSDILTLYASIGPARGKAPSHNGKICCRKAMLFPIVLFLQLPLHKWLKIQCLYGILSKFFKIFSKFPSNFFFKPRKVNAGYKNIFESMLK